MHFRNETSKCILCKYCTNNVLFNTTGQETTETTETTQTTPELPKYCTPFSSLRKCPTGYHCRIFGDLIGVCDPDEEESKSVLYVDIFTLWRTYSKIST